MTALTLVAGNISANDVERGSQFRTFIAGEAITLGMAVYLDSSNKVWKAKSDSAVHATAIGVAATSDNFYGETSIPAGGTVGVCVYGPVWGFSGMTQGQPGWVSATAGVIDDTAPTGGAYQFQVGHAIGGETFFVDPGTTSPVSHA